MNHMNFAGNTLSVTRPIPGSNQTNQGQNLQRSIRRRLGGLLGALVFAVGFHGTTHAQSSAKPDLKRGEQIATQVCAACHGADGNSGSPANPKLAGQHADYLYKQLVNFKVKAGAKEAERANPIMAGFAGALSDADMRSVAAYYAGQKYKPAASKNKDSVALGEKIYRAGIADKGVPSCAGCHSPNGAGIPAQYARIGGQYGEYTEAQLVSFRQGGRKNSLQMSQIAARMSDQEIKAVADYVAGLR
jgi:cytochrome c553